jgi:hypothetical protein
MLCVIVCDFEICEPGKTVADSFDGCDTKVAARDSLSLGPGKVIGISVSRSKMLCW